eukprot:sb/3477785/
MYGVGERDVLIIVIVTVVATSNGEKPVYNSAEWENGRFGRGACELEKKCNQPIPSPMYPKWSPETPKSFGRPGMKGRGSISGFTCMRVKYFPGTDRTRKYWSLIG